jgi:hypothetical protein
MPKLIQLAAIALPAALGLGGTGSAQAYDRHVELVNATRTAVVSFHASNTASPSWEEDILGRKVLPAGYHVRINLDDGTGRCRFDFKTRFSDGSSIVRRNVDVCAVTTYTLTDR